jgi:MFS family permease
VASGTKFAPLSYRQLLRLPNLPALLLATCLSRLATRIFALAIVLYALDRFHSPVLAGWAAFAAMAPGMAISPLAGALLDRIGPARAILADMAACTILVLGLATAGWFDAITPPLLLTLVAIYSLTGPLSFAGIRTLIPFLVPAPALDRANALDTSIHALIDIVGPAVAGVLIGLAGGDATMLAIAVLYGAAAVALLPLVRVGPLGIGPPGAGHRNLLREAAAGVAYVLREPTLRALAVSYSLGQMSLGILVVMVPVYVDSVFVGRELGIGASADSTIGGIWAIGGAAGGLGALLAGQLRTRGRERNLIGLGMLATAVAIFPIAAMLGFPGLMVGIAIVGFLAGPVDVALLTLRQRRTDPAWLGRVLAVSMSLNMSGMPLGSALGGALVEWSMPAAFAAAALAAVLSAASGYALIPRGRD